MGFPQGFRYLLLQYVCIVSFQIFINRKLISSFTPTWGHRQCDLLSLYIFILCVEDFLGLIKKALSLGDWQGLQMGKNAQIFLHSFFTDDCLLFIKDSPRSVDVILKVLQTYEQASRQSINFKK